MIKHKRLKKKISNKLLLIGRLSLILRPDFRNRLKLKELTILLTKVSHRKLQKVSLFLYVTINIHRSIAFIHFYFNNAE